MQRTHRKLQKCVFIWPDQSSFCETYLGLCPYFCSVLPLLRAARREMIGNERGRCDKVAPDGKWKCSLWLQLSASNKTQKSGTFFFVSYLFWRWIFKGEGHKNSFGRSFFMTSFIKSDILGQRRKQAIKSVQQRLDIFLIADIQQDMTCSESTWIRKETHVLFQEEVYTDRLHIRTWLSGINGPDYIHYPVSNNYDSDSLRWFDLSQKKLIRVC